MLASDLQAERSSLVSSIDPDLLTDMQPMSNDHEDQLSSSNSINIVTHRILLDIQWNRWMKFPKHER